MLRLAYSLKIMYLKMLISVFITPESYYLKLRFN